MKFSIPFIVFSVLAVFLAVGLWRDPHLVPSPLIDRPAPEFQLARLDEPRQTFSPKEMRGKVWLLNTWASWCVSCRQEHPLLLALSRAGVVPIFGLDYKDRRGNAMEWLRQNGNPYVINVQDIDGRVGIDYGVYGVPETYLIDKDGVIRYKQIGPLTLEVLEKTILPMIRKLNS
ncbi:MAG TPA: DsbE family thiol:disulfide interchange protein [Terriglobia bacterium]|nr:DsbE family thiol:disulfide interchange protein [Terriglobia bacterium]